MTSSYSFIGPDVFMDERGKLYKKASDDQFVPVKNKYTEAEDRYVEKYLREKGREYDEETFN